ncbi:MAG: hypothetical protein LBB52_07810, partial [Desulfovibrio sp.]|nr:hypothetical protein [Desulfovibrio sp.]
MTVPASVETMRRSRTELCQKSKHILLLGWMVVIPVKDISQGTFLLTINIHAERCQGKKQGTFIFLLIFPDFFAYVRVCYVSAGAFGIAPHPLGLNALLPYSAAMKTEENYGKFLDMLDLALMMQESPAGVTLSEIMEHFDIARRTAERMRNALANYFGPDFEETREGQQKRFRLRSRRLDALTSFSREELLSFSIAAKVLRKNNLSGKADALESAFLKLKSLIKPKMAIVNDIEDMLKAEGLALRPGPKIC